MIVPTVKNFQLIKNGVVIPNRKQICGSIVQKVRRRENLVLFAFCSRLLILLSSVKRRIYLEDLFVFIKIPERNGEKFPHLFTLRTYRPLVVYNITKKHSACFHLRFPFVKRAYRCQTHFNP